MQIIRNKTVVVTGAAGGLGRAIAIAFAQAGVKVGLIARSEEGLRDAQREIGGISQAPTVIAVADTAEPAQLTAAATSIETQIGPPDIWVNNAMETIFSRFIDIKPEEFKRVTEVTYLGFVYGTMEAMKRMAPHNRGHIIQIGSALAYRSIPLQSAYCGGKFAVRGFTDALRSELIHDKINIRLTTVHMPALNTPQFSWARTHIDREPKPVGIIFQPELGADAVIHAALYPRREYWVGGPTVTAILANKFFPGWMDHIMARKSFEQQWVNGEKRPTQNGNLYKPAAAELHKTRGLFTGEAKSHSVTWSIMKKLSAF